LCNKRFSPDECLTHRIVNAVGDYITCWLSRWENRRRRPGGGRCDKGPLSTTSGLYATLPAVGVLPVRPVRRVVKISFFYDPRISRPPYFLIKIWS